MFFKFLSSFIFTPCELCITISIIKSSKSVSEIMLSSSTGFGDNFKPIFFELNSFVPSNILQLPL